MIRCETRHSAGTHSNGITLSRTILDTIPNVSYRKSLYIASDSICACPNDDHGVKISTLSTSIPALSLSPSEPDNIYF